MFRTCFGCAFIIGVLWHCEAQAQSLPSVRTSGSSDGGHVSFIAGVSVYPVTGEGPSIGDTDAGSDDDLDSAYREWSVSAYDPDVGDVTGTGYVSADVVPDYGNWAWVPQVTVESTVNESASVPEEAENFLAQAATSVSASAEAHFYIDENELYPEITSGVITTTYEILISVSTSGANSQSIHVSLYGPGGSVTAYSTDEEGQYYSLSTSWFSTATGPSSFLNSDDAIWQTTGTISVSSSTAIGASLSKFGEAWAKTPELSGPTSSTFEGYLYGSVSYEVAAP